VALTSGTKLGPYEILSPLGAGGMGEVYRALDIQLERSVAIKVLPANLSSDPGLRQRLEREAKAVSTLNHPHICTLHDIGSQDGVDFLVMELLEGETLADRLRRGPLPLEQIAKVGSEIADGLDAAHRAGIVHRDLKPSNIMLAKSGAKLMDFGLAKPAATSAAAGVSSAPMLSAALTMTSPSPQGSPLTTAGSIVGTIQYMSPEQIEGRDIRRPQRYFCLRRHSLRDGHGQARFRRQVATQYRQRDSREGTGAAQFGAADGASGVGRPGQDLSGERPGGTVRQCA